MLTVSTGARTDVGRVRRLNEDSYVIGRRLWMVADGMGGHAAGDVASHLIAERFDRLRDAPALRRGDIETALREANTAVVGYGISHPVAQGLGIGPLPCFIADQRPGLVRLLPPDPDFATGL